MSRGELPREAYVLDLAHLTRQSNLGASNWAWSGGALNFSSTDFNRFNYHIGLEPAQAGLLF